MSLKAISVILGINVMLSCLQMCLIEPTEVPQVTLHPQQYYTHKLMTAPSGLVVEHSLGVREVVGLIPSRVIPKTIKMVLDASLLSARYLKDRSRTYGRFPRCRL